MEPPDRKKRILVALVPAVVMLAVLGNFFWPLLKSFGRDRANDSSHSNLPLLIFGGIVIVIVLSMVGGVVRGIRKTSNSTNQPPRDPKPWLRRPDWAAGRVKSSTDAQWKIMLFMGIVFSAVGISITAFVVPKELQKGNHLALLALIFPLAGIGLLTSAIRGWLAQRRYGECFFELASIPGAIGGTLEGAIQTGTRLRLEHGLHLKLSCIRRTVSGSGDNRSTSEDILWQDEKVFKSGADLPETEPGRSGIPVYFKIPASQPECSAHEGILWRLEAKAKMAGPDFITTFDVPIFQVAGVAVAEVEEPDPTAALQMPVEELRRDEHSKIQIADGPDGHEFYFPAARNLGTAFGLTFFFLIWTGFTLATYLLFKDLLFEVLFTAADIFIFIGCLNLWFKSSRVTIDGRGVTAVNRWLIFSRTRRLATDEIVRFDTKIGMTNGNTAYHCLKLVTRASGNDFAEGKARFQQTGERPPLKLSISDPRGVTIASGIASKPEADWLVQEMTKALDCKGR